MVYINIKVSGMSCSHCARRIEEAIRGVSGVKEVKVELESGRVWVGASDGVKKEDVVRAVEQAGYRVDE